MVAAEWSTLFKPAPRKILHAMLAGATTLTEIAQATRLSKPSLLPHLKALEGLGVVEGERLATETGWEARYRMRDASLHLSIAADGPVVLGWATIGPWDPAFPLLSQIPASTIRTEIGTFLRALAERVEKRDELAVIVYGSVARGEATWKSDIDLVIVADDPRVHARVEAALAVAVVLSEHVFRPVFVGSEEFAKSRKRIVTEAAREGIVVWVQGEVAPWTRMERYGNIST